LLDFDDFLDDLEEILLLLELDDLDEILLLLDFDDLLDFLEENFLFLLDFRFDDFLENNILFEIS